MKYFSALFLFVLPPLLFAQSDSLDIKIGQMVLIGYPGPELDTTVLDAIKSGKAGSIILFEKNVPKSTTAFATLKKVLWTYQHAAPIPLLICIDQEGGRVNRLKDKYGFPRSITASAMGKAKTLDSVRFYAEAIASNLAGLGFNVNFAPVVDVATNPDNPVIAKAGRSFSANADSVTLLAKEYIIPHRKFGVITALKHFPGHGSSEDDTHFGIADVTKTWTAEELKPYRELITGGYADAVMSAHIVNKTLDPKGLPGTLSNRVLDSLLRRNLGFDGVVFSDDMHMHAITKHYGMEEATKLAINAGIDILCFSNNIQNSEESTANRVHSAIRKMVLSGEISRERIDLSYRRIMRLKSKLGQSQAEVNRVEAARQWQRAADAERRLEELKKQQAATKELTPPAEPETKKTKKRKKN
jgi:beta-N-acetylhexosaminidase